MHESASKDEFVKFAVKDILLGYMTTKPARKIEQVMAMILGKIIVPWHICNYQDEIKCCEHVCCTSQHKV